MFDDGRTAGNQLLLDGTKVITDEEAAVWLDSMTNEAMDLSTGEDMVTELKGMGFSEDFVAALEPLTDEEADGMIVSRCPPISITLKIVLHLGKRRAPCP